MTLAFGLTRVRDLYFPVGSTRRSVTRTFDAMSSFGGGVPTQELDKELCIDKSIIGEPARCAFVIEYFLCCSEGVLANGVPNLGGVNRTETRLSSSGVGESPFEFIPLNFWAVLRCSMSLKTVEVVDQEEVPQAMAEFW
jgi:hypothetical protein